MYFEVKDVCQYNDNQTFEDRSWPSYRNVVFYQMNCR